VKKRSAQQAEPQNRRVFWRDKQEREKKGTGESKSRMAKRPRRRKKRRNWKSRISAVTAGPKEEREEGRAPPPKLQILDKRLGD